jgi:hypothetical protein
MVKAGDNNKLPKREFMSINKQASLIAMEHKADMVYIETQSEYVDCPVCGGHYKVKYIYNRRPINAPCRNCFNSPNTLVRFEAERIYHDIIRACKKEDKSDLEYYFKSFREKPKPKTSLSQIKEDINNFYGPDKFGRLVIKNTYEEVGIFI